MTFEEYKEKIKSVYVKIFKDAGKEVSNPEEIFAYVTEETVQEMHRKGTSPEEAYWLCALASMQIKHGK